MIWLLLPHELFFLCLFFCSEQFFWKNIGHCQENFATIFLDSGWTLQYKAFIFTCYIALLEVVAVFSLLSHFPTAMKRHHKETYRGKHLIKFTSPESRGWVYERQRSSKLLKVISELHDIVNIKLLWFFFWQSNEISPKLCS